MLLSSKYSALGHPALDKDSLYISKLYVHIYTSVRQHYRFINYEDYNDYG